MELETTAGTLLVVELAWCCLVTSDYLLTCLGARMAARIGGGARRESTLRLYELSPEHRETIATGGWQWRTLLAAMASGGAWLALAWMLVRLQIVVPEAWSLTVGAVLGPPIWLHVRHGTNLHWLYVRRNERLDEWFETPPSRFLRQSAVEILLWAVLTLIASVVAMSWTLLGVAIGLVILAGRQWLNLRSA